LSEVLDAVDAKILDLIQHDAGLSVAEIAERVGLSSSPCWRRIKRLEDAGVIQRRVTILDREKLGLGFEVYCTVKLSLPTKDNLDSFEQAVGKLAEVVQCATVTGAADYELRIVTRDMHAFDDFLRDKILSLGLVSNIESRIVIRGVKNSTAVPLGLVSPYVSARTARPSSFSPCGRRWPATKGSTTLDERSAERPVAASDGQSSPLIRQPSADTFSRKGGRIRDHRFLLESPGPLPRAH
jgi:Lrp/AsnC family transcriptional regulator